MDALFVRGCDYEALCGRFSVKGVNISQESARGWSSWSLHCGATHELYPESMNNVRPSQNTNQAGFKLTLGLYFMFETIKWGFQ